MYRRQGEGCASGSRSHQYLDLTPVNFEADDDKGYTWDFCVDCGTTNYGGIRSLHHLP